MVIQVLNNTTSSFCCPPQSNIHRTSYLFTRPPFPNSTDCFGCLWASLTKADNIWVGAFCFCSSLRTVVTVCFEPNKDALLYDEEIQAMATTYPKNFRVDYALSRCASSMVCMSFYLINNCFWFFFEPLLMFTHSELSQSKYPPSSQCGAFFSPQSIFFSSILWPEHKARFGKSFHSPIDYFPVFLAFFEARMVWLLGKCSRTWII